MYKNKTKKQLIEELIESKQKIKDLQFELEKALNQYKILDDGDMDMMYEISHSLKSPLTSIECYISVLKEDILNSKNKADIHYISTITNNVTILKRQIQDILEYSRIMRWLPEKEIVNLELIIYESVENMAYYFAKNDVNIKITSCFPEVLVDKKLILIFFANLLSNAIKFRKDKGSLTIEIGNTKNEGNYIFFVKDNGIGIKKVHFPLIFNIFWQNNTSSLGTGIGLTIAKKIIEIHGEHLWVESEGEGKGSKFCFTLPLISTNQTK